MSKNPPSITIGTNGRIKTLAKTESREKLPKLLMIIGKTAACAEMVIRKIVLIFRAFEYFFKRSSNLGKI